MDLGVTFRCSQQRLEFVQPSQAEAFYQDCVHSQSTGWTGRCGVQAVPIVIMFVTTNVESLCSSSSDSSVSPLS